MPNSLLSSLPFFKKPKAEVNAADLAKQQELEKLKEFSRGLVTIQDIIAPEAIEVDFTFQKINSTYTRTLFVAGYPRSVPANWLSPLINFPHQLSIGMFIYPVDSAEVLDNLKRKITEMEAEIQSDLRAGKISNINTEIKLEDARYIREDLAKGSERFFQFGLYITITAPSKDVLDKVTKAIQSSLGSLLIVSKKATLQMDEGFKTTLPMGLDKLVITRNMDTTSLATTFPFTSSELAMETGIVYGINEHNDSLVIFDRFKMENANMVIFAKSGAGKSYTVKLEVLRQMMFGCEVIVMDPEHEYEDLCKAVGGEYINFTFGSQAKINPFDLSALYEEGENELGQKIISIHGLLKVMLGAMTPQQEAILDRALVASYKAKGITPDPATQTNSPPLMEDLYKALIGMENKDADDIAARLEKYITGSFRGIFDQGSNINIKNQLTVFSVKEMEEELRPVAMYVILDFIWTRVKKDLKKRLLIIDEAWYFMKYSDSASFIYSMVKRARKYYLGITTITQDVEDFLHNDYGKAIVTNASIQFLMKQSSASIPVLAETFFLSQGERQLLVTSDVGEGIFFAGQNHVAIRVVASDEEHSIITTNPEELLKRKVALAASRAETAQSTIKYSDIESGKNFGAATPADINTSASSAPNSTGNTNPENNTDGSGGAPVIDVAKISQDTSNQTNAPTNQPQIAEVFGQDDINLPPRVQTKDQAQGQPPTSPNTSASVQSQSPNPTPSQPPNQPQNQSPGTPYRAPSINDYTPPAPGSFKQSP